MRLPALQANASAGDSFAGLPGKPREISDGTAIGNRVMSLVDTAALRHADAPAANAAAWAARIEDERVPVRRGSV